MSTLKQVEKRRFWMIVTGAVLMITGLLFNIVIMTVGFIWAFAAYFYYLNRLQSMRTDEIAPHGSVKESETVDSP